MPKLTPEERRTIYQQIERLDGEPSFEPTSEMRAAIDEGTRGNFAHWSRALLN
jgi:hypothetical protein